MPTAIAPSFQPRKTPLQARSTTTVDAIFEATIQVLLRDGADRLTTTRIAQRAGVSVGTLYQYYPNKQALLHAILAQHLSRVTDAVETACLDHRDKPLASMIPPLVHAYVDAKMFRKDASAAFYAIAAEINSKPLVASVLKRSHKAIGDLLRTATDARIPQLDFTVTMLLSTMTGTTRAVLDAGATRKQVEGLRHHLVVLAEAYLTSTAQSITQPVS